MPYADNNGVKIHYEVEGDGPPLILQHGVTSNLNSWRQNGYADTLREKYKLILVDARGHGLSDKPHQVEAYKSENVTEDIIQILNDLGLRKAIYWGYSMGARIGFQLLRLHTARFGAMVFGGMSPYPRSREALAGSEGTGKLIEVGVRGGAEAAISYVEGFSVRDEALRLRYHELDWRAAQAAYLGVESWPSIEGILSSCSTPCFFYVGDKDHHHSGARRAAGEMPVASFVSIPGLDHLGVSRSSAIVLPHVMRFLSGVK
jgi:pimeloyl-ACP methyl ester carboxylesterase